MDKKQQILEAAIELFATRGFENTAISAICEKSHVSKGLVFHYFKSKNDLLREVFMRMAHIISDVSKATDHSLPAKERLGHLIENIFSLMASKEHQLFYRLDYQVITQPATRSILIDLIEERNKLMMESFQSILCDMPSANSSVDSHMLIAEISGIAISYLFDKEGYPLEEIRDRFIEKNLMVLGQ